jgi:hypothetical protein
MTLSELVMPFVACLAAAHFGRYIDWPFPAPNSARPRQIARHDLSNAVFWAMLTSLVVSSGLGVIEYL